MLTDVWLGKCQLFRKALGVTLKTASVTDVTFSKGYCKIFPKTEHISKASSVCLGLLWLFQALALPCPFCRDSGLRCLELPVFPHKQAQLVPHKSHEHLCQALSCRSCKCCLVRTKDAEQRSKTGGSPIYELEVKPSIASLDSGQLSTLPAAGLLPASGVA